MFIRKKTVGDLLDHVYDTEWSLQKGARKQKNLIEQIKTEIGKDTSVKRINYDRLEQWVVDLRKAGKKEATIARRLTTLRKALRVARTKGWIRDVPDKPPISISNTKERFISKDEEAALLNAARRRPGEITRRIMPRVMTFLLGTGCRLSELCRILPHDISDDGVTFRDRKGSDTIKVPLTASARQAISELLNDKWRKHWTYKTHDSEKRVRDLAIENLQNRLTHEFTKIRKDAGIPDVSLHTYRHTCCSRLLQGGYDPFKTQKWMGHKDIKVTLGRYGHLMPHQLSGGANILESYGSDNVVDLDKRRISED